MSPDVPDKPVSFARLQQQMILTEVELMKLEDLRDELLSRVTAADRLRQDMQRLADQACAERDHLGGRATELETALRQVQAQLAAAQAQIAELNAQAIMLAGDTGLEKERANKLSASLAAIESSASWRWTAPLRRLFGRRT